MEKFGSHPQLTQIKHKWFGYKYVQAKARSRFTLTPFVAGVPSIDVPTFAGKAQWTNPKEPDCHNGEVSLSNLKNETGKIGYIILWLLGVPASILVVISPPRLHINHALSKRLLYRWRKRAEIIYMQRLEDFISSLAGPIMSVNH